MSTSQQAPIIFYSWQSDSNAKANKNFIQKALDKAVKAIAKEGIVEIAPRLDHDVKGVVGSPNIAETIFRKIEASQVFVCDISLVTASRVRKFSNPNVLVELGYALKALGNERIIMVINTAKYSEKYLPFDLRQLRVLRYNLPDNLIGTDDISTKTTVEKIQKDLEDTLKKAIKDILKTLVVADVVPEYIRLAVQQLNKPNTAERKQGIDTLAYSNTVFAKNALLEALKHDLPDVRVEAATVLVTRDKDLAALPVLEKALIASEVDINTQMKILVTLQSLGDNAVASVLRILEAKKDDRKIASNTIGVAAAIGSVNALAIPLEGLNNRDIEVRKISLDTVGKIFTEGFIREHIRYKKEWETTIRTTIETIVASLNYIQEDRIIRKKAFEVLDKLNAPSVNDVLNRWRGAMLDPRNPY